MERITYRITLDTYKSGIQRTLQGFETADKMSRRITASLVAGGDTYELPADHIAAMMYVTSPDATEPIINDCTIEDNVIVYDVLPITTEGITEMQIKLIETSPEGAKKVLVAPRFAVEVTESSTSDEEVEQSAQFTSLENAIAQAKAVYDARLVRIEIDNECVFKAYYADGSVYENDALREYLYKANHLMAKSYAVGGTGVREGEEQDNAKYYSNVSRSASADATITREKISELADEARLYTHYTIFKIDFDTGELSYLTNSYEFDVNEDTGELEVTGDKNFNLEQAIHEIAAVWFKDASDKFQEEMEQELEEERLRLQAIGDEVNKSASNASESEEKAKYYYEQSKNISESFSGALKPRGTVTFGYLAALTDATAGDMYNISEEFVTTSDFKEGSGNIIPAGSNVYRTSDGYWDVLAGSPVTGVKGDKESTYRRGNVNITAADVGALTDEELNAKLGGLKFVSLTQAEYDALETKDADTIYFTTE